MQSIYHIYSKLKTKTVILLKISTKNFVVESHASKWRPVIFWGGRVIKFIELFIVQRWHTGPFHIPLQCGELKFMPPWCLDIDSVEFVNDLPLCGAVFDKAGDCAAQSLGKCVRLINSLFVVCFEFRVPLRVVCSTNKIFVNIQMVMMSN